MKSALKEFRKFMFRLFLLLMLVVAVAPIIMMIVSVAVGEAESAGYMAIIIVMELIFIGLLVLLMNLFMSASFKKKIAAQEKLSGSSLQEQWDNGAIALGKGVFLTKDWLVRTNSPAFALHKDSIINFRVQKDFQRSKEVHTYTIYSNEPVYVLTVAENKTGENLDELNRWFKRRKEELNLEAEGEKVQEESEAPVNPVTANKNTKKNMTAIAILAGGLLVLLGITSFVSSRMEDKREINQIIKNSQYDTIKEYTSYLKKAAGNGSDIEFFLDPISDDYYVITVDNNTDLFYNCSLLLDSEDENSAMDIWMARAGRSEYYYRQFEDVPDTYTIEKESFYDFTYPNVSFDYVIEDDWNDEYQWENVTVPAAHLNADEITVLAERQYAECVLSDIWYELYYVYDKDVEKVEYEGYEYFDPSTAAYAFTIDLEEKTILLYEYQNGEFFVISTIEMK